MIVEEWRAVVGHPGYEVSNLGRIRSLDRITKGNKGSSVLKRGRVLSQTSDRLSYMRVGLWSDNKMRSALVHRLVCQAFHGDPGPRMQVNHRDGDRKNNRPENLEWVTCQENHRHAYDVLKRKASGGKCKPANQPRARRFDLEQVARLFAEGLTTYQVAERIGCSQETAWRLKHGKHWMQRERNQGAA